MTVGAFSVDPSWCIVTYTATVIDNQTGSPVALGSGLVSFDQTTRVLTFE